MYRWLAVLPTMILMMMFAYIDRVNLSFAMSGIETSLGVTSTISGLISGIFFIGYTILQAPGGNWASTRSAKKSMLFFGIVSGLCAAAQGIVESTTTFLIVRFLMGLAQGIMFPTCIVLLTRWFAEGERGRASNIFMGYSVLGPFFMSPICGWLITNVNWYGMEGWRWMLIIEGVAPALWAVAFYFLVADRPAESAFIGGKERAYLETAAEKENQRPKLSTASSYWKAALNKAFLLYSFSWFCMVVGNYGISMWLPDIIKQISNTGFEQVGLIAALPWLLTFIAMIGVGYLNDKWGNKKMLIFLLVMIAGLALCGSALFGNLSPWLSIVCITIAMMGAFSAPPTYVTGLPLFVAPAVFGGLAGISTTICNLGGFFGPLGVGALITWSGGDKMAGLYFLAGCYILSGLLMLCVNLKEKVGEA